MYPGVDAASRLSGAAVQQHGYRFAARYASRTPGKDLSSAEAKDLLAHQVDVVLVWETTADRALQGGPAGLQDGAHMRERMDSLGCPTSMAAYFACDFPAQPRHYPVIGAYRTAFAGQLGGRPDGVYGPSGLIEWLRPRGCRYGWQASATSWSGGHVTPLAQILQIARYVQVGGVTCDLNEAHADDIGAWRAGAPVPPIPIPTPPVPIPTPPAPTPVPTPPQEDDDMLRAIPVTDPDTGGVWWCRTATGSIYADANAPYLGGLTDHPDWGGAGTPVDPVAGFHLWKDQDGAWGYVIVTEETRDPSGLHFYHFDRRGTFVPKK